MIAAPTSSPTAPASTNPTAPGYATTEFWAGVVFPAVFLLLSQFNIFHIDTSNPHVEAYEKAASYIFAAVGTGFYAHSRGHMKASAAIAAALHELGPWFSSGMAEVSRGMSSRGVALPENMSSGQLTQLTDFMQDYVRGVVEKAVAEGKKLEEEVKDDEGKIHIHLDSGDVETFIDTVKRYTKDVEQDVEHGLHIGEAEVKPFEQKLYNV